MSKIFSKILIIFTLTLILLGSGISFKKDSIQNTNIHMGVTEVLASEESVCKAYTNFTEKTACEIGYKEGRCPNYTNSPNLEAACNAGLAGSMKDDSSGPWYMKMVDGMKTAITGALGKFIMMIQGFILQILAIPILSVFLRIVGAMLDLSIRFTLSTDMFRQANSGIITVWTLIRDICNITFIFILLFTAIKTILGSAGTDTKKMIASVITAAILINFSLFITRIIIDAGNFLATSIYNLIMSSGKGTDFSAILIDSLGLAGISGGTSLSVFSIAYGVISWLQVITLIAAIVVFMYALILMAVRIVILVFLCALAPIGFMGSVIPKLQEYSKMWWENLYGMVFVAPIFLLFIYLIVLVGGSLNTVPEGTKISQTASATNATTIGDATIPKEEETSQDYKDYFKFFMIIILLMASVKVTKKMSGEMGKMAEKFGGMAVGAAIGVATGGAALLGRQTIGRGMNAVANGDNWLSNKLKDSKEKGGLGGFASRMTLKGADYGSKAKFDARNTSTFKTTMKEVSGRTGLSFDTGKAGGQYGKGSGFAGWQSKVDKATEDEALARDKRAQEYKKKNGTMLEGFEQQINDKAKENIENTPKMQEINKKIADLEKSKTNAQTKQGKEDFQTQIDQAKKEAEEHKNNILEQEKKKAKEELIKTDKKAKYAFRRVEAKKNYAEQVRKSFFTLRTTAENKKMADSLADKTYSADKEKADKESKNILDLIEKAIKEAKDK